VLTPPLWAGVRHPKEIAGLQLPVGVLSIGFFAAFAAVIGAQTPTAQWKAMNDRDNRFEGTRVPTEVAAKPPELISFYAAREPFDPAVDPEIAVDFIAPAAGPRSLTARELVPILHYWMEAKPGNAVRGLNTFAKWMTGDVLRDAKIGVDDLAIVVRLESPSEVPRVAPAILRRATSVTPTEITSYNATFRSELPLSQTSFTITSDCNSPSGAKLVERALGRKYARIGFPVTFDLGAAPAGYVTLTLRYKVAEIADPSPDLKYCFWHQRNPTRPLA
jgi:hypothetical protein